MQPIRQIINDAPSMLPLPVELHHKRHYFDTELEEDNEYAAVFNKQAAMRVTKNNSAVKKDTTGLRGAWRGDLLLPKRCQ